MSIEDPNYTDELFEVAVNLRCCGNCSWRRTMDMGIYIAENCAIDKDKTKSSSCICRMWDYDDLHNKDRFIKT